MKSSNTASEKMPYSWPALLRAAKRARALSKSTGTPFYIMRNGKIVDLNKPRKTRTKSPKSRHS